MCVLIILRHSCIEIDQSKNTVCYLEISYSILDLVSLLIFNINNVLLYYTLHNVSLLIFRIL